MEMAVRSMETVETAMETNGDGSEGASPSRQGAGTETSVPPKFIVGGGGAAELFWKFRRLSLGFTVGRLFIGEGALSGGDQGGHTMGGHGQGLGRAPCCVGSPCPPSGSRSVFGTLPRKIRLLELVSFNSENISCVAFLKHKTS
jgi:hypothetical protein